MTVEKRASEDRRRQSPRLDTAGYALVSALIAALILAHVYAWGWSVGYAEGFECGQQDEVLRSADCVGRASP